MLGQGRVKVKLYVNNFARTKDDKLCTMYKEHGGEHSIDTH